MSDNTSKTENQAGSLNSEGVGFGLELGIGLRPAHYAYIFEHWPEVDWFEIISENFMRPFGRPDEVLGKILEHYPVVMHGVSLYFGSLEPYDPDFLRLLKNLVRRTESPYVSDHLCWGSYGGIYSHDLLPLPYTKDVAKRTAERISFVQNYLEVPVCVENVSSYLSYRQSQMTEWEFLTEVAEQADCGILLDVNNVYVSSFNHHFDPYEYLKNVPLNRVRQIHLAGPSQKGDYLLDTHDHPVPDLVWDLYKHVIERTGPVNTLLEWDAKIPDFLTVQAEAEKARAFFCAEARS